MSANRPTFTTALRGYDLHQVDAAIDTVVANGVPPNTAWPPRFDKVLSGYECAEVDAYFASLSPPPAPAADQRPAGASTPPGQPLRELPTATFTTTFRGYDRGQVEALFTRAMATLRALAGDEAPPPYPVTSAELRRVRFPVVLRGYNRGMVDDAVMLYTEALEDVGR